MFKRGCFKVQFEEGSTEHRRFALQLPTVSACHFHADGQAQTRASFFVVRSPPKSFENLAAVMLCDALAFILNADPTLAQANSNSTALG